MGYALSRRAMVEEPRVCQRGVRLVAAALLGLAWVGAAPPAAAQPLDVPATYGGDLWTRPRLSGDWFGYRDELAKKGVALNVDVLLTPQGVATGGRDTGAGSGATPSTTSG